MRLINNLEQNNVVNGGKITWIQQLRKRTIRKPKLRKTSIDEVI